MIANRLNAKLLPLGLTGALAAALIAGAAFSDTVVAKPSPDKTAAAAQAALAKGQVEKAIQLAEAVVAANPREAAYRALLGQAYLRAGRFDSAATAFDDAMKLGDNSARSALGFALSNVARGRNGEAVAILDDWRDAIPASDLGLALALAGETSRGVAVLSDAMRAGDASAKLRQNLAYAYALDGRWREARVMVAQDVPADQVDKRISDWAMRAKPEDAKLRIAGLLGVPMRGDPGLPVALALGNAPVNEQLAAEAGAASAIPAPQPQQVAAQVELPAANPVPVEQQRDLAQYAPVSVPAPAPAAAQTYARVPETFATAFAPVAAPAPAPAEPTHFDSRGAQVSFVSRPVVQAVPASYREHRVAAAPRAVRTAVAFRSAAPQAARAVTAGNSHLVQMGSFRSAQGARRAWGIYAARNPELRNFRMTITPAVVRGKHYWRVAAAGFDAGGAQGMCANLKARGGVCFAYAGTELRGAPARPAMAQARTAPARVAAKR